MKDAFCMLLDVLMYNKAFDKIHNETTSKGD